MDIIYASWYFSDRWGSNEESGCTLHLNIADFDSYVKNYHDSFTNERVIGSYHIARKPQKATVSETLYNRILSTKNGLNISYEDELDLVENKDLII